MATADFNLSEWLGSLALAEYHDILVNEGYDKPLALHNITAEELEEIGVIKKGHKKILLNAVKTDSFMSFVQQPSSSSAPPKSAPPATTLPNLKGAPPNPTKPTQSPHPTPLSKPVPTSTSHDDDSMYSLPSLSFKPPVDTVNNTAPTATTTQQPNPSSATPQLPQGEDIGNYGSMNTSNGFMTLCVGKVYDRTWIHDSLGGQKTVCISTPSAYPYVILFAKSDIKRENDLWWFTGNTEALALPKVTASVTSSISNSASVAKEREPPGVISLNRVNNSVVNAQRSGKRILMFNTVTRTGRVCFEGEVAYVSHTNNVERKSKATGEDASKVTPLFCLKQVPGVTALSIALSETRYEEVNADTFEVQLKKKRVKKASPASDSTTPKKKRVKKDESSNGDGNDGEAEKAEDHDPSAEFVTIIDNELVLATDVTKLAHEQKEKELAEKKKRPFKAPKFHSFKDAPTIVRKSFIQ